MRLKLATLNVWGLPEPLARDVPDRMDAIAAYLLEMDADVVLFQEVWVSEVKERLLTGKVLEHYPWTWHQKEDLGGGGLLALSRYPILEAHFVPYLLRGLPQRLDHADYYAGKGFVHLRLATARGPVAVINTHLHAQYARDVGNRYRGIRTGQVVQLSAYLAGISEPLIAAGDFNTYEGKPVYRILQGLSSVRDTAVTLDRRQMTVRRANAYRQGKKSPDSRKDYIFYRDGVMQAVQPVSVQRVFDHRFTVDGRAVSFSNHDGVLAEFELAGCAPKMPEPPERQAIELAFRLLRKGKNQTENRRAEERGIGTAALAVGSLALTSRLPQRISRRRFLQRTLLAFPVVSLPSGAGFLALSELHGPDELEAYNAVLGILNTTFEPFPLL